VNCGITAGDGGAGGPGGFGGRGDGGAGGPSAGVFIGGTTSSFARHNNTTITPGEPGVGGLRDDGLTQANSGVAAAMLPTGSSPSTTSDFDGDGVTDANDVCLTTPRGTQDTNNDGCPNRDAIKPKVSNATPTGTAVKRNKSLIATFSGKMNRFTVTRSTFKLYRVNSNGSTTQITNVTVSLSSDGLRATLNPYGTSSTLLAANITCRAIVTTGARDLAGNALDQSTAVGNQQKVWSFKTGSS
jgi:Bacterial Ig-like domain